MSGIGKAGCGADNLVEFSSFSFYIHLLVVGGAVEASAFVFGGKGFLGVVDSGLVPPGGGGEEDAVAVGVGAFIGCLGDKAGQGVQELLG